MSQQEENGAQVIRPDENAFARNDVAPGILWKGARFNIYERTTYPPEGGIFVHYRGMLHPKKGFPYPEAVMANNSLKKTVKTSLSFVSKETLIPIGLFALLPWKLKMRAVGKVVNAYCDLADNVFHTHYLKPERYCKAAKEIWRGTAVFMNELGFDPELSDRAGRAVATIFEYDDSYRYFVQDLAGATWDQKIYKRPAKEIRRLGQVFYDRDGEFEIIGSRRVGTMVKRTMGIVALALYVPRVKRAFRKAIAAVDFRRLELDEGDKYHVLMRNNYNFFGESFEVRKKRYIEMHNGNLPPEMELTDI